MIFLAIDSWLRRKGVSTAGKYTNRKKSSTRRGAVTVKTVSCRASFEIRRGLMQSQTSMTHSQPSCAVFYPSVTILGKQVCGDYMYQQVRHLLTALQPSFLIGFDNGDIYKCNTAPKAAVQHLNNLCEPSIESTAAFRPHANYTSTSLHVEVFRGMPQQQRPIACLSSNF